jgi:very-short-patch-repair endonuclease
MTEPDRWDVPKPLRRRMVGVARELRKRPTPSESILWAAIREQRLDGIRFRRQLAIGSFVVDFCAPSHKLVVEVDGAVHDAQVLRDAQRQELLESLGFKVVRLRADEVEQDLPSALSRIRAALHH